MNRPTYYILFILLMCFDAKAQDGHYSMGARSTSLGNTSVTLSDEWAIFNNIGGLASYQQIAGFISYKNKYLIPEFSTMAAGMTLPIWNGTAGIGFFRFGDDLYNEQRASAGFSNQFGIVSLGINLGYYQLSIEGSGTRRAFLIDFGGQAKLTDQLYFGAHVSNLNQAKISEATDEKIPMIMKTGLSYRPHNNLMINIEVEKEIDLETLFKVGLEYQLIENVYMRTGFNTNPFEAAFGIGFQPNKFKIDYGYGHNDQLGGIHELSLSYQLKK